MEKTWNPKVEHIEGRLCEKGFMKETFDENSDELVRNLTSQGKETAENLLKDPEYKRAYLLLAQNEFKKYPLHIRKILWKRVINQIRNINNPTK